MQFAYESTVTVAPPLTDTSPKRPCFWRTVHTRLFQPLYNGYLPTIATFFCTQGDRCRGSTVYSLIALCSHECPVARW